MGRSHVVLPHVFACIMYCRFEDIVPLISCPKKSNMHKLLAVLSSGLDGDTKNSLQYRVDNMMSGIRFEAEKRSKLFSKVEKKGWTLNSLEVLCCLNAFYQIVLGPIASATRGSTEISLGSSVPIQYGEKVQISERNSSKICECHREFLAVTNKLGISIWCLQSPHSNDLLYQLAERR